MKVPLGAVSESILEILEGKMAPEIDDSPNFMEEEEVLKLRM